LQDKVTTNFRQFYSIYFCFCWRSSTNARV